MANQQHLDILKRQGVRVWNAWRKKHPEIPPDLIRADLHGAMLNGVNFHRANLEGANLHKAILSTARLSYADFGGADLSQANLSHADLSGAHFKGTNLDGTNFGHVSLRDTEFAHVDLSAAKGLDTVRHVGPSTVGLIPSTAHKGPSLRTSFEASEYQKSFSPTYAHKAMPLLTTSPVLLATQARTSSSSSACMTTCNTEEYAAGMPLKISSLETIFESALTMRFGDTISSCSSSRSTQ